MQADQINEVVDKLSEKIGVAVGSLEPLAEEIVSEVVVRGAVGATLAGVAWVATLVGLVVLGRHLRRTWGTEIGDGEAGLLGGAGLFLLVALVVSSVGVTQCCSQAVAPRLFLLRELLG